MKLQVTARHQSPVSVNGPKSAPHFSSDKVDLCRFTEGTELNRF